jgi:hypothetical protein
MAAFRFSSSRFVVMYGNQYGTFFPQLEAWKKASPRLLWLSCGRDDVLLGVNRKCEDWLQSKGIHFVASEPPGAHARPVWRRNLAESAPLLFQTTTPARSLTH